jgi:O-antigen/teichoic acid export membrane protein
MSIKEKSNNLSEVTNSLQKITKGTTIIFFGSILAALFIFVIRILIARNFLQAEYGLFSLGLTILSIIVSIGCLGLMDGTTRQLSYYLGRKEINNARDVTFFSLLFGLLAGLILFLGIFFYSDFLSIKIFNSIELSNVLQIFSISIPFFILINILTAIFRGFQSVKEMVIFVNVIINISFIAILCFVIWTKLTFEWVIIANSISIIITSIIFIIYFLNKKLFSSLETIEHKTNMNIGKKLLFFSLPLLLTAILFEIVSWTDILMLGHFGTIEMVGLYDAASPLARSISGVFLSSIIFIYMPVVSELYARDRINEIRKGYVVLTKWLCIITIPSVMVILLYPEIILNFLFGKQYIIAATTLQILVIGSFINNLMGLNGAALTAVGRTKFIMYTTFIAAFINVILCIFLIPRYGVNGAAIATLSSLILNHILKSAKLYSLYKINPFGKKIVIPIFLSSILILIVYFILNKFFTISFWMVPIVFFIFLILYFFSLLLTKSLDKEDIEMLLSMEKKTGLNLKKIKWLVNKFI